EDVTGAEQVPQRAEQADLALPCAGVPADSEVHYGPTSQGDDGSYPGDRKADARLLIVDLRIGFLIRCGVRHGYGRTIEQVDVPAFPQPLRGHVGFQGMSRLAGHIRE